MQITTDGMVIRERPHGEGDKVVTLLTRQRGVITAYAKNATKPKSRLANATELLCYSRFVLFENRNGYIVDHADVEKLFFGIRQDMEKLALASYFCELLCQLMPEEHNTDEFLRLALNSLHLLESDKRSQSFLKPVFELRLLTMAGYMPDLVGCGECGCYEAQAWHFYPRTGGLLCQACAGHAPPPDGVALGPGVLAAMRHIIYAEFVKLFSFTLGKEALQRLGSLSEQYLLQQTETNFSTLQFYHSLFG